MVYAKILKTVITTRDHELAFYEASKWVYANGSSKLLELWGVIEKGVEIKSSGNMGRLKTSFTYACIEINRGQPDFMESLVKVMLRGGDTETNCAVVMGIVGAIVGYNRIPNYLKQKIVNSRMKNSPRPRDEKYSPHNIVEIIEKLSEMDKNSR